MLLPRVVADRLRATFETKASELGLAEVAIEVTSRELGQRGIANRNAGRDAACPFPWGESHSHTRAPPRHGGRCIVGLAFGKRRPRYPEGPVGRDRGKTQERRTTPRD